VEVGRTGGRAANPLGFAPPPLLLPPLCATLFTPALPKTPAHGFSPPHCPCRYNERELRWVALDTWTFSLQFDAPRSLLSHAAVLLRCDGLDTVASIELNGSPVGAAVNSHRPHSYDVTQLLAEGPNRLAIRFESAAGYAAAQRDAYPYPVPHTQQVGAVPGYNFIRKAARQASFQLEWVLLFFLVPACKARVQGPSAVLPYFGYAECHWFLLDFPHRLLAAPPQRLWLGLGPRLSGCRHHRPSKADWVKPCHAGR